MFTLYYFFNPTTPSVIFKGSELADCLQYITSKRYSPQFCLITTPNNRRITFNSSSGMIFSEMAN